MTGDREIILEAYRLRWRRICLLDIDWPDNGAAERGTGFFVGPKTILTAGHCIFSHERGGWADQITATPACAGDVHPYKSHQAAQMHSVDGWIVGREDDFDYGAIVLANAVGAEVGWFSLSTSSDMDLGVPLELAGYPVDKLQKRTMWRSDIAIQFPPGARRVTYGPVTSDGDSGAPVFVKGSDQDSDLQVVERPVVAIHTIGLPDRSSGARVTDDMIKAVESWCR